MRRHFRQGCGFVCLCLFNLTLTRHSSAARPQARLSPADQAVRANLRQAVDGLETGNISRQQFERLAPRRNLPTWQRLQRRIRYPRFGALDLAFVLAYYGVDYRRNLQRLLLPDQLWQRGKAPMPESLSGDLMILHGKHRDTASLGALLALALDGGPGEEQADIIYKLWQQQPATLLRLASGSEPRLKNLETMLLMEYDGAEEEVRKQLQRFARHPNRRVAEAARKLLPMVEQGFAEEDGRAG